MKNFRAKIIKNACIAKGIYELYFQCPKESLRLFKAGQFAHIRIPGANELLLRRPFSICSADPAGGAAAVVYQVAGQGTARLSACTEGELDVLLPLGNGFPTDERYKKILLAGGGIGIAPLKSVTEQAHGRRFDAALGYKAREYAYMMEAFKNACGKTVIASDDGSIGFKGLVTDALHTYKLEGYDAVFACGPVPMLKALQSYFEGKSIPVFASLEERMGCGMGGCAVCVCKLKGKNGFDYKKVCSDGPVFPLSEVIF